MSSQKLEKSDENIQINDESEKEESENDPQTLKSEKNKYNFFRLSHAYVKSGVNKIKTSKLAFFLYILSLVLSMISGGVIVLFGIWLMYNFYELSDISTYLSFNIPCGIIIFGSLIIIRSCAGFMLYKNPSHLLWFGYCLVIHFSIDLFICVTVYFFLPDFNDCLTNELKSFMMTYKPSSECCNMMDEIQFKFECCGVQNSTDWLNLSIKVPEIPQSCCQTLPCNTNLITEIYSEGCKQSVTTLIMENKRQLENVLFPIPLIELFSIGVTFNLANKLTRQQYEQM